MTGSIAGHIFRNSPTGRVCDCGRTWLSVLAEREYWRPGEAGIAHSGNLNAVEVGELQAELDRVWTAVLAGVEA